MMVLPPLIALMRRCRRPKGPPRENLAFLPAALEILETPASPGRVVLARTLSTFLGVVLIWAYVGRIDIVAEAQGKIQPTGRIKVVQPLETGKVKVLAANNGMRVKEGAILLELDASEAQAEEQQLRQNLTATRAEALRRRAVIAAIEHLSAPRSSSGSVTLPWPEPAWDVGIPPAIRLRETQVLRADIKQLVATLASLAAQRQQKQAEIDRLTGTIAAEQALIATLNQRVIMRLTLVEHQAGTKAGLIDAQESLQHEQTVLAADQGQQMEARAALTVINKEMAKTIDTFVADNHAKLAEAERQADELTQKLAKASARVSHMVLRSPVRGTVQASAITNLGQVVTAGEEVMRIVPDDASLEIEAYLANKDVGFVHPGQEVVIKLEAFPFTRYGTLSGRVVHVARDAIPEPDAQQKEASPAQALKSHPFTGNAQRTQNLVFPVIVKPDVSIIQADGITVPLTPGMAATVEIKTGKRRILEYLTSPVVEIASQALKER